MDKTCCTLGCERTDTRPYLNGPHCPAHAPGGAA